MVGGYTVTTVTAAAPVRLDFAGAWTDVAPFADREGGAVVSAAIALHAHAEYTTGGDDYMVRADDLGIVSRADRLADLPGGGPLALLCAAARRFAPTPGSLRTWSAAPAGAGLGGSGALGVALVAALSASPGAALDPAATAETAWELETVDAGRAGGRQDQYTAAYGGFHRFGFSAAGVTLRPLTLPTDFADELARRIVICYTGQSRLSSHAITRVMDAYVKGDRRVTGALRRLAGLADQMTEAFETGDLAAIGRLLDDNWNAAQELDDGMRTDRMAALETRMRAAGALGGKAAGAGAGGSMFFLVRDRRVAVDAARQSGATVLPATWAMHGVTVR
jgi:D-glycero-alpha-D-manno-heptose-7-phosphate kinase